MSAAPTRIPVTLVTGFLGAGKTTLLNHLLRQPELAGTVVLMNEFGAVPIDHLLVERLDEELVLLESGCLCCSLRGDLARSLRDLFMRRLHRTLPALERVVIETTGLADPAPVIFTLTQDFFVAERYRLDGVVTVVDALFGRAQLGVHPEAVKQAALADRLLISKVDQAAPAAVAALEAELARLNPGAPQRRLVRGELAAAEVLACGGWGMSPPAAGPGRWRPVESLPGEVPPPHDGAIRAVVLFFDAPLPWGAFSTALDRLQEAHGAQLLRVKGIVNVRGEALPRVVQGVHHLRYPVAVLPAWPDEDRRSRLVFIVQDLPQHVIEEAFASLRRIEAVV